MPSATPQEAHATDLREYIRVLRTRKWEVSVVTVAVVAAAMFFTLRQTPVYEGQTKVLVKDIQNPLAPQAFPIRPNLDTEREVVASPLVAELVRRQLHLPDTAEQLLRHLSVEVLTDTEVLLVRYDDPNARTAASLANSFARNYIVFRRNQVLQQFTEAADTVQKHIDAIRAQLSSINSRINSTTNLATKSSLQAQRDTAIAQLAFQSQRLSDLQAAQDTQNPSELLKVAQIPTSPVSPNKIQNGILALIVGLALGVGLAFVRERLDDRVKTRQEIERRLGVPVIAAVPRLPGWRKPEETRLVMKADPKSPVSESYRTLATNIQYIASRQPLKVLMVTSALGGEGKTTTSANLAIALAKAGRRVVLISADLRKPRIHHFFGLANDVGLSNVLSNSTNLPQVAKDPGIDNLRVIAGGPIPQDPAELLGSRRASEFIESLRDVSDFVVIDTPPVLAVADASILAPLVDGAIFVMDAEHSSRSAMLHARDQLNNAGAQLVGAVHNNFDPGQSAGYSSYYYYYQYYGSPEPSANGEKGKEGRRGGGRRAARRSSSGQDFFSSGDPESKKARK